MTKKSMLAAGCAFSTAVLVTGTSWAGGLFSTLIPALGWAGGMAQYEVTITNLTPGQPLAASLVATHRPGMSFFEAGAAPAPELADLAEAGNGQPMADKLNTMSQVSDAEVAAAGAGPGGTQTVMVSARPGDHLSFGAMLGATNDAYAGLADVELPRGLQTLTYMAPGYDAGTETNDESATTVPAIGGAALSPADNGEGFVAIHNGIHGIGDLPPATYDWRNPVAKVVVRRVR